MALLLALLAPGHDVEIMVIFVVVLGECQGALVRIVGMYIVAVAEANSA